MKTGAGYGTEAAVGARLRRLSELLERDAGRLYDDAGVVFEQRWFGVLNQLALRGPATVSELAKALRITHASVSQTRRSLELAGLVVSKPDTQDRRKRHLRMSRKGRALWSRLTAVWDALEVVARQLDKEAGGVIAALDRFDAALQRSSLYDRATELISRD